MARPSIPVDVIGNTAQLRRQIEELSKTPVVLNIQGAGGRGARGLERQSSAISDMGTGLAAGGAAARSFNQPLGKISGNVSEIDKSLGAANARVIAFGAAAGGIFALQNAVGQLFTSFVNTEKKLAEINTVLNLDQGGLQSFGKQIFRTAGQTGQSFDVASEAALEFSRQGLGVEETTKRTRDALVLSRLSGLDAASSVNALTASVNSYRKSGLTTGQVVNKLANVDAGFAVSSADLAEALSRVGSSAQDAGVSFDELIALVTSAQQTTARGGAVIGNSLKTIFTRLNREKTTELFEGLGISTLDEQGNEKNQIGLLKDLAGVYNTLGTQQKNYVAEQVGGVFQLNILKAALSDLGRQYSVYDRALQTSLGSTNQAEKRNEQLNQTLSGLGTQTLANVQSAASTIGGELFAPAAKNVLNIGNFLAQGVNESESSSVGTKLGQGIISGLGSFLGGPGLALIGAVLAKLFGDFSKYGASAGKSLLGLDQAAKNQATIQQSVAGYLQKNASLYSAIASGQTSVTSAAKQYLQVINQQSAALQAQAAIAKQVAAAVTANVGRSAVAPVAAPSAVPVRRARFSGFIPNFGTRDYYQEVENAGAASHKGGYRAGILKGVTVHDGMGNKERAWMTSRESKKTFTNASGFKATQITPPNGFSSETMVASSGFVPNFGAFRRPVTKEEIEIAKKQMAESGRAGYLKSVGVELTDQQIAKELRNSTLPMDPVGRGKALNDKIQSLTEGAAARFNKQVGIINQRRQSIGLAPLTESRIAQLERAGARQPTQNEWNELFKNQYRKISSAEYEAAIAKDAKLRGIGGFKKGGYIARPDTPENQVINLGDLSSKPGGISLVHSMERGPQAITAQTPIDTKKGGSGKAYRASVLTSGIDTSVIKGALPNTKQRMEEAVTQLANDFGRSLGLKNTLTVADIPNAGSVASAAGVAFEQALTGFVKRSTRRAENARVDFADPTNLRKFFYNIPGMYEAKQNPGPKNVQDVIKKYIDTNKEFQSQAARAKKPNIAPIRAGKWTPSPEEQRKLEALKSQPKTNNPYLQAYSGFIPNFGPNIAAIQKLMTQGATSGERQAAFAAMQRIQSNALSKLGTGDKLAKFRELLYGSKSNAGFNLDAIKIKDLNYKPLLAGAKELGLSMKDLELLAGNPIAINQLRGLSSKTKSSSFAKGFLPFGSGQKLNPLLGRNTFQANWMKEFAKKNNIDLKNPDAMFKIASAFAKKYPNEQPMFGFNSGFIPNFASEFKAAQKRAMSAEKSFGKGAVMDEYRGMSYVRQPGQSSNFKTMMRQDHPEGLKAALNNSAAAQGLSRGFIPNFAPNEEEYGGGLTASAIQGLLMTLAFTLPQRGSIAEGIKEEKIKNAKAYNEIRAENLKAEARKRFDQKQAETKTLKQAVLQERKSGKITQKQAVAKFAEINKTLGVADESLKKTFGRIERSLESSNSNLLSDTKSANKALERLNSQSLKQGTKFSQGLGQAASKLPFLSGYGEKVTSGFESLKQKGRGVRESQIFKGPGAGLGGAIAAPILAETIAAELGRDTTGGRIASAAGNAASFALTGAAIGGPKGALVGGIVGGGMLLNEIITARGSTLSETSKESEKATQEAGRINDLASQALSDIGDYYEAVGSQGPDSKKAKQLKKQLTSTISKFGPDSAKKLFEAFYQGPEKFQEEIGKQPDQAVKEQKTREAGQALSKISESTRARKSFAGIFTSQLPDLIFGQETKGGLRGYTSDIEKENISDIVRQGLFGDLGSQEVLDRVEKDFGGAGNLVKIFTDAEAATKKFEERVKELGGTGGQSLEQFAETLQSYGLSDGKEFLSTIDKQKKALLDLTEKGFGTALSESGRKAFLENLDVTALRKVGGDVAKDIVEARNIIKQEEDIRTTRGESNQMRVAQQMAKVQSEMQDYTGRGGESFGEIISSYQTEALNKLERERMAGPTPDAVSYREEREAKRQEGIQKSQRRLDFLQQYGIKGSKSDMQNIIQEAYSARIAEAEDLGIANMPGLKQSIFENIRRQVYGFAGRGDETAQYEVDMKADAKRRQQAMPEYIQKKSQFEQQISGYSAEQLVKEQEKVKGNLGIQQELLGLMRSEAGMTGEGAAQKMIKGIDREIQDMGPVFSYEKDRQDQLQSLLEKRSQVENYLPQLRQTDNDYNLIRGQEAGSEMMIQSMQQMLQSLRQGTKEQRPVPVEDKDASGKATNQAANNMATSADKMASASEKAATAMTAFATSAASSIEKLAALSAMPMPTSNAPNTSAMGFIPNFAMPSKKIINQTKNLESFASGRAATYHTNPFPHVRNTSQPTFDSAMRDHGGLKNALQDSAELQKNFASGFIPNFASFAEIKNKFNSKPGYSTPFSKIDKIKDFFTNFRAPKLSIPNFAYNPEMVPGNAPKAIKKAFANVQEVIAVVSQNLGFNARTVNAPTSMSTGQYGKKGAALAAVTTSSMGDSDVWFSDRLGRGNTLGIIANEATHVNQGLNILYDRNSYTNKLKSFADFLESKGMVTGSRKGSGFSDNRVIALTTTKEDSIDSVQKKKKEIQEKADLQFKQDISKSESGLSQFAKDTTLSLSQKIREESEKTSSALKDQHGKTLRDIEGSFKKNKSLADLEMTNLDQAVSQRRGGIGSEFLHPGNQRRYETERLSSLMHGLVSGIQVGNINAQDLVSSGAAASYDQAIQIIESVFSAEQILRNSGINAARGFIPNFSDRNLAAVSERLQAKNANYRSGILKTVTAHDGSGNSFKTYANSRETITKGKNAFGYKATMIEPPNGFNFAAQGFIPNFAPPFGMISSYDPETEALRRIISGTEAAPAPEPVLSPKMREFAQANKLNYTLTKDGTAISRIQDASVKAPWGGNPRFESPMDYSKYIPKEQNILTKQGSAFYDDMVGMMSGTAKLGVGKAALRALPLVGLGLGAYGGVTRALRGDTEGALMEIGAGFAGMVPGWGSALSLAISGGIIARDMALSEEDRNFGISAYPDSLRGLNPMDRLFGLTDYNESMREGQVAMKRLERKGWTRQMPSWSNGFAPQTMKPPSNYNENSIEGFTAPRGKPANKFQETLKQQLETRKKLEPWKDYFAPSAQVAPAAKFPDSATATTASGEYPVLPQPDRPFVDAKMVTAELLRQGQQMGGEANRFVNAGKRFATTDDGQVVQTHLSNAEAMGIMAEAYFGSDELPGMGYTQGPKPAVATDSISAPTASTSSKAGAAAGISSIAAGAKSSIPIGGSSGGLMADRPFVDAGRVTAELLRQGQQMGGEANRFVNAGKRFVTTDDGQVVQTQLSNAEAMGIMAEAYFGSDELPGMGYTHGPSPKRLRDFDPWGNNLIGGKGAAATLSAGGNESGLWSSFLNRDGNWEKRRWPDEDAQKWANDPDSGSMGAIIKKQLREEQEKQVQRQAQLKTAAEAEFQKTGKWPSIEEISAKYPSMNPNGAPQVTRKVYPGDPLNAAPSLRRGRSVPGTDGLTRPAGNSNWKPTEYTTGNNGKYIPIDEAPVAPILPSSITAPAQRGAAAPMPMPIASTASYMNGASFGSTLSFGYSNPQTPQGGYGADNGTDLSDSSINGIQQGMENAIKNSAPAMSSSSFGITPPSYQPIPYANSLGGSTTTPNAPTMGADPIQLAKQSELSYANADKPVYDFNYTSSQTPPPVANAPYVQSASPQAPMIPQPPQQQSGGTSFQSLEQAIKSAEQTIKSSEQSVKSAEQAVRELANKDNKNNNDNGGQNSDVTLEFNVDVDPPEVSIDLNVDTATLSSQLASLPGEVMGAIQPTINQIQTELTRVKQDIAILFQSLGNNR